MPKKTSDQGKTVETCSICSVSLMGKSMMIDHLLGKKHRKKSKERNLSNVGSHNKSIRITGLSDMNKEAKNIILSFYSYGLVDCFFCKSYAVIEFSNESQAKKAIGDSHALCGVKLEITNYKNHHKYNNLRKGPNLKNDINLPPLSLSLQNRLKKIETGVNGVDDTIIALMREIELKPKDEHQREELRNIMQVFLSTYFPGCETFVFGSSANSLGFAGCDVDMVANLRVPIWENRSKEEGDSEAGAITRYLAKEIRVRNMGYRVIPIPRARVPIIKFVDCFNHLQVDLSFKNGMPIYNTKLIKQYTKTHPIVRPYLMMLRYWAKAQGVAGGAQPTTLITNYCLCMVMLFWLMVRDTPIVPCIGELQKNWRHRPVYVNGWNCSFAEPHPRWINAFHKVTIIELALEFFEFLSNIESSEWVISPLQGALIPKEDIKNLSPSFDQPYLHDFYFNDMRLQLNTPLCVQDPFEISHNIARGLKDLAMVNFQRKCSIAADICRRIMEKKASLHQLFEEYKLEDLNSSDAEVINMVDSSNDESSDSVELEQELESLERVGGLSKLFSEDNKDTNVEEPISLRSEEAKATTENVVEVIDVIGDTEDSVTSSIEDVKIVESSSDEIVILSEVDKSKKVVETVVTLDDSVLETSFSNGPHKKEGDEFGDANDGNEDVVVVKTVNSRVKVSGNSPVASTSNGVTLVPPNSEINYFDFKFSCNRNFCVTSEGNVKFTDTASSKESCIINLWSFILKCILKCVVLEEIVSDESNSKRKGFETENELSAKFLKVTDGKSLSVDKKFERINNLVCKMPFDIFSGRKPLSKDPSVTALSPLQYEVAISNLVETKHGSHKIDLQFETSLWKETSSQNSYRVVFDFDKEYKRRFPNIINRLPLFCQNIFRHADVITL